MTETFKHVAQVGGDHYETPGKTQHWDLMLRYDVGYVEGNASKYICRYKRKGVPLLDLQKGKSYLEKMLAEASYPVHRRLIPLSALNQFFLEAKLDENQTRLMTLIHAQGNEESIIMAAFKVGHMITQQQALVAGRTT
jgi:hypothetical protein